MIRTGPEVEKQPALLGFAGKEGGMRFTNVREVLLRLLGLGGSLYTLLSSLRDFCIPRGRHGPLVESARALEWWFSF